MTLERLHHEAFCLFEKGKYRECLTFISSLHPGQRDAPVRILEAVCLLETGRTDEGELCLRDLRLTVPGSAEVCIYLGRILLDRGDDEARFFFSEAVRLDPDNCEGLSWYADFLLAQEDYPSAIPVLVRLHTLSGDSRDLCRLMRAFRMNGKPGDAVNAFQGNGNPDCCRAQYLAALSELGKNTDVISAIDMVADIPEEEFLILIRSLEKESPDRADQLILPRLSDRCSTRIIVAYIHLLLAQNRYREAIGVWSTYLSDDTVPENRVIICPALISLGNRKKAREIYQSLLFPDPPDASIEDILIWLNEYRVCILAEGESVRDLMDQAGGIMHPSYLTCAGICAEEAGLHESARQFYQKAFRSDIVHGGLLFADYLKRSGDMREWEKIVTYILKNTGKVRDIEWVSCSIFPEIAGNTPLLQYLHGKLDGLLSLLSGKGKSIYCQAAGLLAAQELSTGGYGEGIRLCLKALAEVPPYDMRTAEHLFSVLMACKTPGLPVQYTRRDNTNKRDKDENNPIMSGLNPVEEAAFQYIRRHRVCSELELRKVCGTKRVAGLMNRLMRKISAEGWQIIVKEGMSESGEVYRYVGL